MWIERKPREGETVKIEFAGFTKLGVKIGVLLKYSGGRAVIDFGDVRRHLDTGGTFLVWENNLMQS